MPSDRARKQIAKHVAAMPVEPIRDGVVQQAGRDRMAIAEIYVREGELESAADWYLRGAEYAQACGDIIGALALVKRGIRLRPERHDLEELYADLWRLAGLGDEPEPIG